MKGKKRKIALFFMLVAIMFAFNGFTAEADSQGQGVPQLLNSILAELGLISDAIGDTDCCSTIKEPEAAEGLEAYDPDTGEIAQGTYDLVTLVGPGKFVAARMTKQAGDSGLTSVELIIDGRTVVGRNFAALKNWGMTQNNPFGVVVLSSGDIDAATIGFPQSLSFEESLILRTQVGESGVVQMIGTVIYGR